MSIHLSIKCARDHQTRLLLEIGANPNTPDKDSRTPLMLACLIEKQYIGVRIVRMLLQKGAVVSTKDMHRRTALSYACMTGKEKIVKLLLKNVEYDINEQDNEGNTPLIYAAMSGNAIALRSVLEVLMKYRLSVDLRNQKGFSAYLLAAKMGHFYCAHILKTEGYASDGIRDSEYFLSDKEWMKKVRREISAKMQIQDKDSRLINSKLSPYQDSKVSRPHTSVDFQRAHFSLNRQVDSANTRPPRAVTGLTTRGEATASQLSVYNSWMNIPTENTPATGRSSRCSVSSSIGENSFLISTDSIGTETIPSEARTNTPDLHAILSQYLDQAVHLPVKIPPKCNVKNVKFTDATENSETVSKTTIPRQRKQSRVVAKRNSRKNLPAS